MELPRWNNRVVYVLGGGPSISRLKLERIQEDHQKRHVAVVAINEAGLSLYPRASMLYWCDHQWGEWNKHRYHLNKSTWRFSSSNGSLDDFPNTQRAVTDNNKPFQTSRGIIAGTDSGTRVINLLYHCGVKEVRLFGFDMRDGEGNWHNEHKKPAPKNAHAEWFIPAHNKMAEFIHSGKLDRRYIVLNATPNSALQCYPTIYMEDYYNEP